VAWWAGRRNPLRARWVSLFTLGTNMIWLIGFWIKYFGDANLADRGQWLVEFNQPWISELGIRFYLGVDGLSLLMLLLVNFLGIMAVIASWIGIQEHVGFFHFNLMWISSALVGVFMAVDLFVFYFFWEMMLVPLYFLIGIWGHERRIFATLKFFIFTQASSLLMLVAILGLYFIHGRNTGTYTFDYTQLLGTSMSGTTAFWLMMGFFAAFAVKLAVVPVHTWLPDAHTEAPTAGSVDLAGLVLKVGAYGMIRFLIPLFPKASLDFANVAMALGVIGILYGAILAFAQTDLKRLVAYTSVSHMGFVLIGIFAWNQWSLQGAVMIILAHGISTGGLFVLVGGLYDRMHTRDLNRMGGLWDEVPKMGKAGVALSVASLGLPAMGNFVGEFLVLLGTYRVNQSMAILATMGFIFATIYSLWMIQRIFQGPLVEPWDIHDLDTRELLMMGVMVATIIWLGIYPQPVLNTSQHTLNNLQNYTVSLRQPPSETIQAQLEKEGTP
jgi:NADH-quinone oxidoreductase subunit M